MENNLKTLIAIMSIGVATGAVAKEYHVGASYPLKTISAAAELAQPGDTITVHAGVYRERVDPPRGGASDAQRITYQAAPGEKVVITGAEVVRGWERVTDDTWKVTLPNSFFGSFNPFSYKIEGEWCNSTGRHAGSVYRNGEWLTESLTLEPVMKPAGNEALFFAEVGGAATYDGGHLFALKSITVSGRQVSAASFTAKQGEVRAAPDSDVIGWTRPGDWLTYERLAPSAESNVEVEAGALTQGGNIEFRAGRPDGKLLGICQIRHTGGWQNWKTFTASLKPAVGEELLCLVFKPRCTEGDSSTIYAQFPDINPNTANIEISKRQAVFYPSERGINYITVRGFELRQAATPWAGAMSEQVGLIGTHWSKGWIIEDNHIHHSMCTGVTLGRYELPAGEMPPATAPGYVKSIEYALRDGWSKDKIGSHVVRRNRISHCEKNAIHGSLGACFSEISGNEIHDIALRGWVRGADTGGVKFLGGVDMIIRDNRIYRTSRGIWLDWMAQGTRVTGNLLHDNGPGFDLFLEVNHGPFLVDNNLFLSGWNLLDWSEGGAFVHNLFTGQIAARPELRRATPYHGPHSTEVAGLHNIPGGDQRFYNNLFVGGTGLGPYDNAKLPMQMAGNVFLAGAKPSKHEAQAVVLPEFDAGVKLVDTAEGVSLKITLDEAWSKQQRLLVTTDLLGKAAIPDLPFEQPDGSPYRLDRDYFRHPRDENQPFPGPFETPQTGTRTLKAWPRTPTH